MGEFLALKPCESLYERWSMRQKAADNLLTSIIIRLFRVSLNRCVATMMIIFESSPCRFLSMLGMRTCLH